MRTLFVRYINRECTEEEVQQIVAYFKTSKDFSEIPTIEAVEQLLDTYPNMEEADASRVYQNIQKVVQQQEQRKRGSIQRKKYFWRYAAAAILAGVLTTTYFLRDNFSPEPIPVETMPMVQAAVILPGTDKAILTLEDGSEVPLVKGSSFQKNGAKSNGEKITYQATKTSTPHIAYNYLTTPSGAQYFIELSDGTQVWLNSESQLKYPVNFRKGKTREVELVYGEAYFDVTPSENHGGAKFKVFNQSQEIEVFGTAFNIKAYKEETNIYTTLVEGKVFVHTDTEDKELYPSQQLNLNLKNNTSQINPVNVNSEISWKNGVFIFDGKPLKEVMKVIERWYNVDVVFENKEFETLEFKGSINKNQSIERILTIMKSSKINSFEIKGRTILLK